MPVTGPDDLIRRFTSMRGSLLGYLRVIVRDPHLAEDLFQETSLVVLRKIGDVEPTLDLSAWVRAIALNLARNALRKERYVHLASPPDLLKAIERCHASAPPEEAAETDARLQPLGECLSQVDLRQRALLDLRYRSGASLRDIASRTGRSEGAVQVALTRIRQFLLKCVQQKRRMNHGYGSA